MQKDPVCIAQMLEIVENSSNNELASILANKITNGIRVSENETSVIIDSFHIFLLPPVFESELLQFLAQNYHKKYSSINENLFRSKKKYFKK